MADTLKKPRPEFRNIGIGQILTAYRLPLAGRVSILHRLSGGLLFVFLPFLLY
ncbi:succinate dehydrogenase, cytochrome b556 subunit, partial [Paraburkholderia strydomiana]